MPGNDRLQSARISPAALLVAGLLVVVLSSALLLLRSRTTSIQITIGNTTVHARVAATTDTRIQGLSNTTSLPEGQAMLFVFDDSDRWGIWMKDMRYSVDIAWLDNQKTVVDLVTDLSPATYPAKYGSRRPARYVLELPAGFAARHRIAVGSVAHF